MKTILALFSVAGCLFLTPAYADFKNEKNRCEPDKNAKVEYALAEASIDIERAADSLERFDSRTKAKFKRWFGVASKTAIIEVYDLFVKAENLWEKQFLWCPDSRNGNGDYDNNKIAHVYLGNKYDIFISPAFFDLPASGEESKASSILHELMHLAGADLDPRTYSVQEAEHLARTNPRNARRNAQNLEYFAIDIVFGM